MTKLLDCVCSKKRTCEYHFAKAMTSIPYSGYMCPLDVGTVKKWKKLDHNWKGVFSQ